MTKFGFIHIEGIKEPVAIPETLEVGTWVDAEVGSHNYGILLQTSIGLVDMKSGVVYKTGSSMKVAEVIEPHISYLNVKNLWDGNDLTVHSDNITEGMIFFGQIGGEKVTVWMKSRYGFVNVPNPEKSILFDNQIFVIKREAEILLRYTPTV